tara:strand:+ start:235 stop:351 length:117 start_codon:yes stop_codon:yes gene_type:complete
MSNYQRLALMLKKIKVKGKKIRKAVTDKKNNVVKRFMS